VSKTQRTPAYGWEYIDSVNADNRYYRGILSDATFLESTVQKIRAEGPRQYEPEIMGRLVSIDRSPVDEPVDVFSDTNNGIPVSASCSGQQQLINYNLINT